MQWDYKFDTEYHDEKAPQEVIAEAIVIANKLASVIDLNSDQVFFECDLINEYEMALSNDYEFTLYKTFVSAYAHVTVKHYGEIYAKHKKNENGDYIYEGQITIDPSLYTWDIASDEALRNFEYTLDNE